MFGFSTNTTDEVCPLSPDFLIEGAHDTRLINLYRFMENLI